MRSRLSTPVDPHSKGIRSHSDEIISSMIAFLRRLAVSVGLLIVAAPLAAEELTKGASPPSAAHGKSEDTKPSTAPVRPLPVDATTTQVLSLASRKLDFKATAGSIQLSDEKAHPKLTFAISPIN